MTIDIERLKVDESLWPEGATHYYPDGGGGEQNFCKLENGEWFFLSTSFGWLIFDPDTFGESLDEYIPRPEPRQVEWDGLPKSGVDCEMQDERGIFIAVHIIANFDGFAFGWSYDLRQVYFSDKPEEFRPIRTKEQREREEVIAEARARVGIYLDLGDALGRLYDAGSLRKEPKQ